MRFSLKWALAAMAYVALAAAAFGAPSDFFNLSLWAVAAVAFFYAWLVAIASRGQLRVLAAGFALSFAGYCVCIYAFPYRAPWYAMFESTTKPGNLQRVFDYQRQLRQLRQLRQSPDPNRSAFIKRYEADFAQALRIESTNALGAMAAGLIGCGLGALAYRHGRTADR